MLRVKSAKYLELLLYCGAVKWKGHFFVTSVSVVGKNVLLTKDYLMMCGVNASLAICYLLANSFKSKIRKHPKKH